MKSLLPPGYRSVQDFILHYHQNNRCANTDELPAPQQPKIDTTKIKRTKVLDDSPEAFKKEIVMKKIPNSKLPETIPGKRQFYEKKHPSDVHPSTLTKPDQITFHPITKF